jgi:hypothetical protein
VKRIDRALLVRHEHLAGALVELRQVGKTPSGTDDVLPHPPTVLQGGEFERGISESSRVGIQAASGRIGAYFLFLMHSAHSHAQVGPRSVAPTPRKI